MGGIQVVGEMGGEQVRGQVGGTGEWYKWWDRGQDVCRCVFGSTYSHPELCQVCIYGSVLCDQSVVPSG